MKFEKMKIKLNVEAKKERRERKKFSRGKN
jgi:hypothetical protein